MKFQNPSFNFLNIQTDGKAEINMLPTFSKLGHKKETPFSS